MSLKTWFSEVTFHRCFPKWVFLKVLQYSQENTCSGRCRPPVKDYRVLLLQNTYGCCFWIFTAENAFFNWLRYLLLTVTPVFPPNSFGVKRQKQPLKLLLKKGVFRNFASFTGKQLCWSLFLIELQMQTFRPCSFINKRMQYRCFPKEFTSASEIYACECLLLKPVLSPGLPFLITYTSGSN